MRRPATTPRRLSGLASLLGAVLVLIALEGVFRIGHRVAGTIRPVLQASHDWFEFAPDCLWRRRAGFSGDCFGAMRTFGCCGLFDIDQKDLKTPGRRRILLVGDSCTFGNQVPVTNTYGEILERLLPDTVVINAAVPGYSSYQGVKALETYAALCQPRVAVISFNANDRRYMLRPDFRDGPEYFRRAYLANRYVLPALTRSYVLGDLLALLNKAGFGPGARPVEADVITLTPRVSPEDYRSNLVAMARYAKARGIIPVFLVLGDNPRLVAEFEEARLLLAAGNPADALGKLERIARDTNSYYSAQAGRLAVDVRMAGGGKAGNNKGICVRLFHSAHGGYPVLPAAIYQDVMRETALREQVLLVDATAELNRRPDCFFDMCHFDATGHEAIARLLADALRVEGAQ